jgi:hypothetical protein
MAPGLSKTVPDRAADAEPTSSGRNWLAEAQPPLPQSIGRPGKEHPADPGDVDRPDAGDDRRNRNTDGAAAATSVPNSRAPQDDASDSAESELAAPQVRFDQAVPPSRPEAVGSERAAVADRRDRAAVTRHAPEHELLARSVRSIEPISDLEAAAFAGRFTADFQSFDEDDPLTRAEVLRPLLADPQASTWGWSGVGRQRADSPLPGRIFRSSDTVVFVEVLVRATTYARAHPQPPPGAPALADVEPVGFVGASSAPPESDLRWRAIEANWVRMTVPVTRSPDDGRLVVDPHLVPDRSARTAR